ncbi:MAG: HNH endonuclease [Candidatus Omnitrophica bacterium]|nr:HNH endonuclease [Candidatus Omnitrophota bacterium]
MCQVRTNLATYVGLELHVDHKEPFSKQGKTVLENLETKCRDCNLGKGNRHSE